MIRRSTLVLLTCLSALSVPAIQTKSVAQTPIAQGASSNTTDSSFKGLGVGSRGEAVRQLQLRLTQSNYYSGPIDGLYGLGTQRAIVSLQRASSLEETGTLNEATWQVLESGAQASPEDEFGEFEMSETEAGNPAITQPTGSKVENELPSVGEIASVPSAENESTGGGIKPVFALGLGLVGLLSSFGVGFFTANRNKRKANDDQGWDTSNLDAVGVDPAFAGNKTASVATNSALSASVQGAQTNSQPMNPQLVVNSQYVENGAAGVQQSASAFNPGYGQSYAQAGATGPLSQTDVIEGLLGELRNPDPAKRRKAIWELGQRGNSIAVQSLVDAMPNADSKEKSLLLAALSEIGIRSLRPMNRALAIAFQDPNPEVRKNAIRDLSRVYDLVVQISHMLGHAVEDEDAEVRQTATWALDKLNHIRKVQDVDTNLRSFSGSGATPIDLLSSEASIRRSQEMR